MTENVAHPLEIEGLRLSRAAEADLEDITLTVRAGEIFGLLGLRGAGKTSLLMAVLRLVQPAAGTIRLFGAAHGRPGARARLAYLPERFQPPGHLSGHDFIRLTLAFHGREMRRARVAVLAEQLGLDPSALPRPIRSYPKRHGTEARAAGDVRDRSAPAGFGRAAERSRPQGPGPDQINFRLRFGDLCDGRFRDGGS